MMTRRDNDDRWQDKFISFIKLCFKLGNENAIRFQ